MCRLSSRAAVATAYIWRMTSGWARQSRAPSPEDAEFTADEIACALGESRSRAYELMGTADHLETGLPGTRAALYDGTLSLGKARLIAAATALLDPAEARSAGRRTLRHGPRGDSRGVGCCHRGRRDCAMSTVRAVPFDATSPLLGSYAP
jgi:hypothetical protein